MTTSFNLLVGALSDGKITIPISASYIFEKELVDTAGIKVKHKDEVVQDLISRIKELFPNTKLIVVADGLYANKNFLSWCITNKINAEMRIRSNCVVVYKGKKKSLKKLLLENKLAPVGRQMARSITVKWHNMDLEITIVRRFDKKENESFVFQVATYKARPGVHVAHYEKQWPIEMLFRTAKQSLGLQDCQLLKLQVQHNHAASVLLVYAIAQLEMKKRRLKTPEEAISATRAAEHQVAINKKGIFTFLTHDYSIATA